MFSAIVLIFISFSGMCQDTVYSHPFPKGIITNKMEIGPKWYRVFPIGNPNLEIVLNKGEVKGINYLNGEKFFNQKYEEGGSIVLETESNTGKVYYSGILSIKNASAKDLFMSLKTISNGVITYSLQSQDAVDFTFQKYVGSFSVKYAGDPYTVFFNLLVKFKDEKVKYEYSDFVTSFEKTKTRSAFSMKPFAVNSSVENKVDPLEDLYSKGTRNGDIEKFWVPIRNNIMESIKSLSKILSESGGKKDEW